MFGTHFGVPKTWRKGQGLIVGKRCGTTENIGPAARQRRRNGLNQIKEAVVGALDAPLERAGLRAGKRRGGRSRIVHNL
jgi:hypothetical protein